MRILDKNFKPIKEIDVFKSLIWHEIYYGCGVFEAHINEFLNENAKYIYNDDLQQLGIILTHSRTKNEYTYTGKMLKALLENKVIYNQEHYVNKTPEFIVKDLVRKYAQTEFNLEIEPIQNLGEVIGTEKVIGENLMIYIDSLLETQELSCRIDFDYPTSKLTFKVFAGADCTTSKPPLSLNFENILDYTYHENFDKFKNFAYIRGEEKEDGSSILETVDLRENLTDVKQELYVNASSQKSSFQTSDGETITFTELQYRNILKTKGLQSLSKNNKQFQIEIRYNNNIGNIGDKRLFKDQFIILEQRITEIITGYEGGYKKQEATFGKPSVLRKEFFQL